METVSSGQHAGGGDVVLGTPCDRAQQGQTDLESGETDGPDRAGSSHKQLEVRRCSQKD